MLKCWSHPCWVGMVCVGSLASSDALWDMGQYAKIAALLPFLWLQHPQVGFLSSYLPDRDFSANPAHLDGVISSYGCNKLCFTPVAYYYPCPRWFCHCYLISSFLFFHEDPKVSLTDFNQVLEFKCVRILTCWSQQKWSKNPGLVLLLEKTNSRLVSPSPMIMKWTTEKFTYNPQLCLQRVNLEYECDCISDSTVCTRSTRPTLIIYSCVKLCIFIALIYSLKLLFPSI